MVKKTTKRILLVEGEADKSFFEIICKNLGLHTIVEVAAPKDITKARNGKWHAIKLLPILIKYLADEEIELTHLAVVVDADRVADGNGYENTIDKVTKFVAQEGYALSSNPVAGVLFEHDEELADFGLWVMPNNCDEGMLEDWIKRCIRTDELELFKHAKKVVCDLPSRKFNSNRCSKAEVATWLAWQEQPGHGLYHIVKDELIDTNSASYKELSNWLNHIYSPKNE